MKTFSSTRWWSKWEVFYDIFSLFGDQSWESYLTKVIYYILLVSYHYEEVTYYSYILLYQKSNFVIFITFSTVIILCNLVTSY